MPRISVSAYLRKGRSVRAYVRMGRPRKPSAVRHRKVRSGGMGRARRNTARTRANRGLPRSTRQGVYTGRRQAGGKRLVPQQRRLTSKGRRQSSVVKMDVSGRRTARSRRSSGVAAMRAPRSGHMRTGTRYSKTISQGKHTVRPSASVRRVGKSIRKKASGKATNVKQSGAVSSQHKDTRSKRRKKS